MNVRFWHKADVQYFLLLIRYTHTNQITIRSYNSEITMGTINCENNI